MGCNIGIGNTGTPSCLPLNEETAGLLLQKTYDGVTRNSLDSTLIGTANYFIDKVNNADENVRLLPFYNLTEVTNIRDAAVPYTDNTGVDHEPVEQPRKFTGEAIKNASPQLLGELEKLTCIQMSTYISGAKGGLFGNKISETSMEGYEIVKGSMYFGWVEKVQNGKPAHITVVFTIAKKIEDKNIVKFEESQMADSILDLVGIQDVTLDDVTNVLVAKTIEFTANTIYGPLGELMTVEDLADTDFVMTLNGSAETIITLTNVDGVYELTYTTAAVATDVVVLTGTKAGYDIAVLTYVLLP